MVVIALKQRYPGHAMQALLAAAGFRRSASMYRHYVTVDDDIDPSDLRDVLWALCTRVDPGTSVEIVRNAWTSDLDPRLTPAQKAAGDYTMGRMLIDACKPYPWKDAFPKTNIFSPEERRRVSERWATLLDEIELAGKPEAAVK
jgi:3-polyprenyl-4-hydroxybenzoate decarboxylase